MGIREKMNDNQNATIVVTSIIIVLTLAFIFYRTLGSSEPPVVLSEKGWFTTDDGATWFVDDLKKIPPFKTSDGKIAVRAFLFKCGDGKPFVGYLQAYTAAAKRQLEGGGDATDADPYGGDGAAAIYSGVQVKKPGAREWLLAHLPVAGDVRIVDCPNGEAGVPEPFYPEMEQP